MPNSSPQHSPNSEYRIVSAATSHLSAIPVIEQAAASLFSEEDLPLEIRYRVTDDATLREAQEEGRLWMALDGTGEPVGFAMAISADGNAHLDEVDVLPEHSRRGIGTRLVEIVIEWARATGFPSLTLVTFRHLAWNAPFYFRFGFETVVRDEIGDELRELLREEASNGINIQNRDVMELNLR